MERLKSAIPEVLQHKISESTPDDLHSTCSSLLHFFENLPLFHQMIRDLTDSELALCGKNKDAALVAKANGNDCFAKRDYHSALRFYSQALRSAPMDAEDTNKSLLATLYLNRASSLHKLEYPLESFRDCNRALIISPAYPKAWYRRGKANVSLENYRDAVMDLNVSLAMETSVSGKEQIQSEINMILDRSGEITDAMGKPNSEKSDEELPVTLHCVSTPAKGRGMISFGDIPEGSLIHEEDPYAAIILKNCRETHCHFCFDELPKDTVPCMSCSIPLYCSTQCQVQAGGQGFHNYVSKHEMPGNLSNEIRDHIRHVTSPKKICSNAEYNAEHSHECCGVHWPAVLPSDVVLAGRVLKKYIHQQSYCGSDPNFCGILDLCHNYGHLSGESKLEFHVYAITLLYCLRQIYTSELPLNPIIASQIIILLSQIRINSIAIVRMKCSDANKSLDYDMTHCVEQVRVAHGLYSGGSLFNHSCQPNVHAYFLSRTIFLRATEHVTAGSELEISYGPQVGQWDCQKRHEFLEDRYSFICQCNACAMLNLSDLVISAYRCVAPNCWGAVLESPIAKFEKQKLRHFKRQNSIQKGYMLNDDSIRNFARQVYEQTSYGIQIEPGHCLSCGSYCNLQASQRKIAGAEISIRRLQGLKASSCENSNNLLMDALNSIDTFRTLLHPFNRRIAEVEDNVAQSFCLIGELQAAIGHCQAGIEILEKLYGANHIVIGHELIKLATIQLSMGHKGAADSTNRLVAIFSRYYGRHADIIFPHIQFLQKESSKLIY